MRDRNSKAAQPRAGDAADEEQADPRDAALRQRMARERKAERISQSPGAVHWTEMRERLLGVARRDIIDTATTASTILAQMELRDEAAELTPALAKTVGQKICDKIGAKLYDQCKIVFELGETVGEKVLPAFAAVKNTLQGVSAKKEKVSANTIKQSVARALVQGAYDLSERIVERIKSVPPDKLAEIGRSMGALQELDDADGDSPETGKLKDGMERQFIEQLGMPATGPARAHEIAVQAYQELRAELRATKPVAEQADELQSIAKMPGEAEQKARGAEKGLGPGLEKDIAADEALRTRVTTQAGG
jgi:hypothetical protein